MINELEINRWFSMKTLKMLVEVENSKIYVYSYDANDGLCASDTVNLWVDYSILTWWIETKKKAEVLL
jgi:hypothetical protein